MTCAGASKRALAATRRAGLVSLGLGLNIGESVEATYQVDDEARSSSSTDSHSHTPTWTATVSVTSSGSARIAGLRVDQDLGTSPCASRVAGSR